MVNRDNPNTAVSPHEFRTTMGLFATGVTVVTSGRGRDVHAMTANAITSVSLSPPLLLFCVKKEARMAARLRGNQSFTVNILDETQRTLSNYFARQAGDNEVPEFRFCDWSLSSRLDNCAAALSCSLYALYDGGDHWIAVGQVEAVYRAKAKAAPLLFYQGQYHQVAPPILA